MSVALLTPNHWATIRVTLVSLMKADRQLRSSGMLSADLCHALGCSPFDDGSTPTPEQAATAFVRNLATYNLAAYNNRYCRSGKRVSYGARMTPEPCSMAQLLKLLGASDYNIEETGKPSCAELESLRQVLLFELVRIHTDYDKLSWLI